MPKLSLRATQIPNDNSLSKRSESDSDSHSAVRLFTVAAVAFATLTVLVFENGFRFTFFLDEGIYFLGARAVSHGAIPYKDFFTVTGPGTFWIYGLLFKLLSGPSFAGARLLLYSEVSLIAACICFISMLCRTSLTVAIAAASLFVAAVLLADYRLYVNHRWDSLLLILCSMIFGLLGEQSKTHQRVCFALSGIFVGAAALCTPPVAATLLVTIAFVSLVRPLKVVLWAYWSGFLVALGVALTYLESSSALIPAWQALKWDRDHYGPSNEVPFGYFHVSASLPNGTAMTLLAILGALLPTILIVIGLLMLVLWKIKLRQSLPFRISYLVMVALTMVYSTYPRWSAGNLLFALPFFILLISWVMYQLGSTRAGYGLMLVVISLFLAIILARPKQNVQFIRTGMGILRVTRGDYRVIHSLQTVVGQNKVVLVYPYMPVIYLLLGTDPPGYYSFLQPGMMNGEDEKRMIEDCNARRPEFVLWKTLSDRDVIAIWPGTTQPVPMFRNLEHFIKHRYEQIKLPSARPVEVWKVKQHFQETAFAAESKLR